MNENICIKENAMSAILKKHAVVSNQFTDVDATISSIEHDIENMREVPSDYCVADERKVLTDLYVDYGLLMTALSCLEYVYKALEQDDVPSDTEALKGWLRSTQLEMRRKTSYLNRFSLI
ncbi:MAG: hypothetical protein GW898_10625 [Thiomicrospira sp.]|nr:hypothetical protein [Thiomicrospira sp.]NCO14811.1 hypothetical protein [Thiomicrospira sp.]NCO82407.1 hypothetical protein [Thiomicrospira sp.]OIP95464.1 MAG: hypothetical protein AUK56_05335 [Thiomicrospira sp. CG2_30_44_34]